MQPACMAAQTAAGRNHQQFEKQLPLWVDGRCQRRLGHGTSIVVTPSSVMVLTGPNQVAAGTVEASLCSLLQMRRHATSIVGNNSSQPQACT